jgi:hypothetical protein
MRHTDTPAPALTLAERWAAVRDLPRLRASDYVCRRMDAGTADTAAYVVPTASTDHTGRPTAQRYVIVSMSAAMAEDDVRAALGPGHTVTGYAERA